MAYLDKKNRWLTKKGRRFYLEHVNPTIPNSTPQPTDLMILQHCHLDCWNTPWKPIWKSRWNHNLGVISGYHLVGFTWR